MGSTAKGAYQGGLRGAGKSLGLLFLFKMLQLIF